MDSTACATSAPSRTPSATTCAQSIHRLRSTGTSTHPARASEATPMIVAEGVVHRASVP
jgi:hypothetical protein